MSLPIVNRHIKEMYHKHKLDVHPYKNNTLLTDSEIHGG